MIEKAPTAEDREIYVKQTSGNDDRSMVAALMHHDSYKQSRGLASTLPEIAAYSKNLTVAQMVRNRINARIKMIRVGGLNEDIVI